MKIVKIEGDRVNVEKENMMYHTERMCDVYDDHMDWMDDFSKICCDARKLSRRSEHKMSSCMFRCTEVENGSY